MFVFGAKSVLLLLCRPNRTSKKGEIDTFCSVFYQLSVNWAKLSPFSAKLKKSINKFQVKEFMNFCESGLLRLPWKLSNAKLFIFPVCSQDVGERSYYEETAVCGCRCEISFRIFC